jgi:hypothetical protein
MRNGGAVDAHRPRCARAALGNEIDDVVVIER